ncbi:MAG: Fe-S protein assembly co-chaperone HscB [Pseudomonadota bacterium]
MYPDYFACFGLPANYGLDTGALKTAYFRLARQYHPDAQAQIHDVQAQAAQQMAYVHTAYETLMNPFARAQYLAKLKGIPAATMSEELLMEQFNLREAIDAAQTALDKKQLKEEVQSRLSTLEAQCQHAFDVAADSATIGRCLYVWPYYQRALAQLAIEG